MRHQTPVDTGTLAPTEADGQRIRDKQQLIKMMLEFSDIAMQPAVELGLDDPELLLGGEVVEKDRAGRPIGFSPFFDFRHKSFRYTVDAFINQKGVSPAKFRWQLGRRYDNHMALLRDQQPNCTWGVVALRIYDNTATKSRPLGAYDRKGAPVVDMTEALSRTGGANADGEQAAATTLASPVRSFTAESVVTLNIEMAFANLDRGSLVDNWRSQSGENQDGPIARYIENRQMRFLPNQWRKERRMAEAVIRRFYDFEEETEVKPARAVPQDIEPVVTIDKASDAQMAAINVLRQDGESWLQAAEAAGVTVLPEQTWRDVMSAVARWVRDNPEVSD